MASVEVCSKTEAHSFIQKMKKELQRVPSFPKQKWCTMGGMDEQSWFVLSQVRRTGAPCALYITHQSTVSW